MKDYKKLVDGLRHCTTVDGCKGCPFDDPTDLLCECSNKVCTGAADAIESLLKGLHETKSDLEAAVRGQETLQKALAEVKAERNWIGVNDKLPGEADELVLAVVSGKPKENIELVGACEFAVYSSSEGWILENWPEWTGAVVTHWMPLPEPPEKEA